MTVELWRWRPQRGDNFGDALSEVVVDALLLEQGLTRHSPAERARLLAVGSILHFAKDGDVLWGVGRNGKTPVEWHTARRLDVRAVRGPLTHRFLASRGVPAPEVFGDPVLLLPELFPELRATPRTRPVVVVPNLNDLSSFRPDDEQAPVIDPRCHWLSCALQILSAQLVVASSLHGLVVAEAFGIPARRLRSAGEPDLKYDDYYLGSGREVPATAATVARAVELGGVEPVAADLESLRAAFPLDLWSAAS